jgi:hypothetical protein
MNQQIDAAFPSAPAIYSRRSKKAKNLCVLALLRDAPPARSRPEWHLWQGISVTRSQQCSVGSTRKAMTCVGIRFAAKCWRAHGSFSRSATSG